jgi:hypothetical protein
MSSTRMTQTIGHGLTLLDIVVGARAWATGKQPWYLLIQPDQQCEPAGPSNSPEAHIALSEALGHAYKMLDVTEKGEVVQTTMIRFATPDHPKRWEATWYRGKTRCEQAKRTKQQADEQWRNEMIRKYR